MGHDRLAGRKEAYLVTDGSPGRGRGTANATPLNQVGGQHSPSAACRALSEIASLLLESLQDMESVLGARSPWRPRKDAVVTETPPSPRKSLLKSNHGVVVVEKDTTPNIADLEITMTTASSNLAEVWAGSSQKLSEMSDGCDASVLVDELRKFLEMACAVLIKVWDAVAAHSGGEQGFRDLSPESDAAELDQLCVGMLVSTMPVVGCEKWKPPSSGSLTATAGALRHSEYVAARSPPWADGDGKGEKPNDSPVTVTYRQTVATTGRGSEGLGSGAGPAVLAEPNSDQMEHGEAPFDGRVLDGPGGGGGNIGSTSDIDFTNVAAVAAASDLLRSVSLASRGTSADEVVSPSESTLRDLNAVPRFVAIRESFLTSLREKGLEPFNIRGIWSGALDGGDTLGGVGSHLVVCVHGLAGNMYDLRLLKLYLQRYLPKLKFMMSSVNQKSTYASFETMTEAFAQELTAVIREERPTKVSFIGHSLGNIIIRNVLTCKDIRRLFYSADGSRIPANPCASSSAESETVGVGDDTNFRGPRLHSFVSLSGPHLGSLYTGGLVAAGMWILAKWKRSASLTALSLADGATLRDSLLYKLSKADTFTLFKNVTLVASPQDKYVPLSSAMIYPNSGAATGANVVVSRHAQLYSEMIENIMAPIITKRVNFERTFVVMPPGQRSFNAFIGRAAHIAMLDEDSVVKKVAASIVHCFV